jgi:hypothetical protein
MPPSTRRALDPGENVLDVEERPDAEPRVIVADAADRVHRHAAADGQLDVLDHLAGVQLEDRDGASPRDGIGDDGRRERPERDRPHEADAPARSRASRAA